MMLKKNILGLFINLKDDFFLKLRLSEIETKVKSGILTLFFILNSDEKFNFYLQPGLNKIEVKIYLFFQLCTRLCPDDGRRKKRSRITIRDHFSSMSIFRSYPQLSFQNVSLIQHFSNFLVLPPPKSKKITRINTSCPLKKIFSKVIFYFLGGWDFVLMF